MKGWTTSLCSSTARRISRRVNTIQVLWYSIAFSTESLCVVPEAGLLDFPRQVFSFPGIFDRIESTRRLLGLFPAGKKLTIFFQPPRTEKEYRIFFGFVHFMIIISPSTIHKKLLKFKTLLFIFLGGYSSFLNDF